MIPAHASQYMYSHIHILTTHLFTWLVEGTVSHAPHLLLSVHPDISAEGTVQ